MSCRCARICRATVVLGAARPHAQRHDPALVAQHVPIQRLQAALRPGWTGQRMAMSSCSLRCRTCSRRPAAHRADLRAIESGPHEVFEDLSLFAWEDADGALVLRADYRADRIDESTIRRVVDDFGAHRRARRRSAGHAVVRPADAGSQASDPPAVPVEQPAADYPRDSCVQELVERQVERTPVRMQWSTAPRE